MTVNIQVEWLMLVSCFIMWWAIAKVWVTQWDLDCIRFEAQLKLDAASHLLKRCEEHLTDLQRESLERIYRGQ